MRARISAHAAASSTRRSRSRSSCARSIVLIASLRLRNRRRANWSISITNSGGACSPMNRVDGLSSTAIWKSPDCHYCIIARFYWALKQIGPGTQFSHKIKAGFYCRIGPAILCRGLQASRSVSFGPGVGSRCKNAPVSLPDALVCHLEADLDRHRGSDVISRDISGKYLQASCKVVSSY